MSELLLGVFVGGASRRFSGIPKGLLRHPRTAETLVERAVRLGRELGAQVVLVGTNDAYKDLGIDALQDVRAGCGPMGGLGSLLRHAAGREAIALACDMPFVPLELLQRLEAETGGDVVVPRRASGLEPLCALYRSPMGPRVEAALAESRFSLQQVLREADRREVVLAREQEHWLDDWDTPSDVTSASSA
jgi:molybdopterin-guanine dinucleotide biosynthesis protein A